MMVNQGSKLSKDQATLLKNALRYNIELFSGGNEIWPDQCDYAISRLEAVKSIVQDRCRLLDNDFCVSAASTTEKPNGRTMVILHYACKQLSDLQTLIAAFQPVCRSTSKPIEKKRAEILKKLDLLILKSDDFLEKIVSPEEGVLQQRGSHSFSESCAVNSSLPIEESSCHKNQQQSMVADKPVYTSNAKLRPPYLTLVRDDYVEGRVIPRLNPVEEEHAMPLGTDKQEQEDVIPDNVLPFMKNTFDHCCLTTNN